MIKQRVRLFGGGAMLVLACVIGGMQLQALIDRIRVDIALRQVSDFQKQNSDLILRFPIARAEARAQCVAEYTARIDGMTRVSQQQDRQMTEIKALVAQSNDLSQAVLRYLNDRAKVNDRNTATIVKQAKITAAAVTDAKLKVTEVDVKVNAAAKSAAVAASSVQAIDKKLEGATVRPAPAPPPSKSWNPFSGGH